MNVGLERKYVKNLINKFRGIRKVKLEVDEVYLYLGESLEGVHLPFKEVAKRFLSYAGVDYKRRGTLYRLRGKDREITRGVLSGIINGLIKALRD
jgi:hypothetical protein